MPCEATPSVNDEDTPLVTSSFVKYDMEEIPHLFVLRPTDGLRLQVENIVKAEHLYFSPLMIVELWQKYSINKAFPF